MIIGIRKIHKASENNCYILTEACKSQKRKDSSFYTKDKPDYSYLIEVMERDKIKDTSQKVKKLTKNDQN